MFNFLTSKCIFFKQSDPNLVVEIFLEKEGTKEKNEFDFE